MMKLYVEGRPGFYGLSIRLLDRLHAVDPVSIVLCRVNFVRAGGGLLHARLLPHPKLLDARSLSIFAVQPQFRQRVQELSHHYLLRNHHQYDVDFFDGIWIVGTLAQGSIGD